MFRKLKLQFIFTNLAIIGILFFLITCGVYFLVQTQLMTHLKDFSNRLADGILSDMIRDFPKRNGNPQPRPIMPPAFQSPGRFPGPPPANPGPPQARNWPPPLRNPGPGPGFAPFQRPGPAPFPFNLGVIPYFPKYYNAPPRFFFVKLNPRGRLFFQSAEQPFPPGQLTLLARETFQKKKVRDIIGFNHTNYYYYKTALQKQPGTLIVFVGLQSEENALRALIASLAAIGILCLVFALFGSLFMAERAIRPIQKAWRQQKDFIADASHELRTPLSVIQTNLEVMLSNPQESVASQMDWLANIREEVGQMADLIASLLLLARLDSNQWPMAHEPFNLSLLVTRVVEAFKPLAAAKGVHLIAAGFAAATVSGDESGMRRVIEILLDNAVRHTPAGGQIAVQLRREDKIFLTIADTGEGIPAAHLDKIFDRFYQVDASRSKGKAGLGLAIAKCIVENHHGAIKVVSTVGAGTVFTLQLPATKDEPGISLPIPKDLLKDL